MFPRKIVQLPDDCWLDALKFLACSEWSEICYVSSSINRIIESNVSHMPRAIIDRVIMDSDYAKKLSDVPDTIIASGDIIPQSDIAQWFEDRNVTLEVPKNIPVEKAIFCKKSYHVDWSTIHMCILGPARQNEEVSMPWHELLREKNFKSVLFYAKFCPSDKFCWPFLEYFLTILFHPLSYFKEITMYPVTQKFVDDVKVKLVDDFSVHGNMTHIQTNSYNKSLYIHCGAFSLSECDNIEDLRESLKWLERNVRANSICISLLYYMMWDDYTDVFPLLNDFVFGVSRICARRELRLIPSINQNKLLTNFIENFLTLPPIECEIPTVVIESFLRRQINSAVSNLGPNLGPNLIPGREVDSQGADFLYVLENGQNRMRISFCEDFEWSESYECEESLGESWNEEWGHMYDCFIKFYAVQ
ncbi:hypothetical protein Ddc_12979 [Ditylenchus destructor]|nr:hypothetical protein Ddc_12979 [Ditylenchus destructor]